MPKGTYKNPQERSLKISLRLKGIKRSQEHKEKIREKLKGHPYWGLKKHSEETKRKIAEKIRGRDISGWRHKIGKAMRGKKHSVKSRLKMSQSQKGKVLSEETKARISESMKRLGLKPNRMALEKHWAWKGGVTSLNHRIRNSIEYKLWRKSVFERDSYKCIWCGSNKSGTLNADHIKPFALYPELRLAIDNGRTLCITCHKTTDSYMNSKIKKI